MSSFEIEWEKPEFDSVASLAENAVYLLPACDDTILRKTLQATYRDFCRRSAALRTWRRIKMEPGQARYVVAPVLSGEVDCVTNVLLAHSRQPLTHGWRVEGDPPVLNLWGFTGGHIIEPGPTADLRVTLAYEQQAVNAGSLPVEGNPGHSHCREPFVVWVEAVETPHMNEERAPRVFLERHGDAIVDGALARMMSMANRPWADAEHAKEHGIAYENAISEALVRARNGSPAANPGASGAIDFGRAV